MSTTKRLIEEKQSAWDHLAASRGWRCDMCAVSIPFEERVDYFETSLCSRCSYLLSKDD